MPPETVLIAEDDADDAFLLQRSILKAGLNVRMSFVRDGQEAMDYLQGEGDYQDREAFPLPKLLLLDLKMPKLNGFDVLQRVRSEPVLKRLPIAVLTSSNLPADINKAFDLGANSYVVKPTNPNELPQVTQKLHDYWLKVNSSPECVPYPSEVRARLQGPATTQ